MITECPARLKLFESAPPTFPAPMIATFIPATSMKRPTEPTLILFPAYGRPEPAILVCA
jgi:hypothetical protein